MVNGVTHLGNYKKTARSLGQRVPMSERRIKCRTCRQVKPGTDFDVSEHTGEPMSVCRACRAKQTRSWADVKRVEAVEEAIQAATKPSASKLAQAVAKHHATRAAKLDERTARKTTIKKPYNFVESHHAQGTLSETDAEAMQFFVTNKLALPKMIGGQVVCRCGAVRKSWPEMVEHVNEVMRKHFG